MTPGGHGKAMRRPTEVPPEFRKEKIEGEFLERVVGSCSDKGNGR